GTPRTVTCKFVIADAPLQVTTPPDWAHWLFEVKTFAVITTVFVRKLTLSPSTRESDCVEFAVEGGIPPELLDVTAPDAKVGERPALFVATDSTPPCDGRGPVSETRVVMTVEGKPRPCVNRRPVPRPLNMFWVGAGPQFMLDRADAIITSVVVRSAAVTN